MTTKTGTPFIMRLIGAVALDPLTYEEVEADKSATGQAALHFALGHPAVVSVVLGAQNPNEVERNVAALASEVPAALWADLKTQHLLDVDAPVPT